MKAKLQYILFTILYVLLGILKCIPRWFLMVTQTWGIWWVLMLISTAVKSSDWAFAVSEYLYWISAAVAFAYYIAADKLREKRKRGCATSHRGKGD